MTLHELMDLVPEAKWVVRVPSVKMLQQEANVVIKDQTQAGILAVVFDNGYVAFRRRGLVTVFPLHSCRDYSYKDAFGKCIVVSYQEFADQPWQVRVFMEGQDRIIHSSYNSVMERAKSYTAREEDCDYISDEGAGDPLNILIRLEESDEKEILWKHVSKLTKRQKQVLFECVVNGKKHYEVAEELGMSRQAVSDLLARSLKQLRKAYGLKQPVQQKRCFSSSRWTKNKDNNND